MRTSSAISTGTRVTPSPSHTRMSPGSICRSATVTGRLWSIMLNGPCPGTFPVAHSCRFAFLMPGMSLAFPSVTAATAPSARIIYAIPSPMIAPRRGGISTSCWTTITGAFALAMESMYSILFASFCWVSGSCSGVQVDVNAYPTAGLFDPSRLCRYGIRSGPE